MINSCINFLIAILIAQTALFAQSNTIAIVIHGGVGTITKKSMTPELEARFNASLKEALEIGYSMLNKGMSSTEAVIATIEYLENDSLYNSGKGAVYTADARHELDASIMTGDDLNAGAVAGITNIKNPIKAAYEVMENSPHVLLSGKGAETFAIQHGMDTVPNTYFNTNGRRKALESVIERKKDQGKLERTIEEKSGTVGCVALDKNGLITAGTSTGGMTYKQYGRIGDSPVIGAGTYADNRYAGVSATGHGEYFIRNSVAYDVVARMRYLNEDVKTAADSVIFGQLHKMGGVGGIIALDNEGNIAMPFNTPGMYRGYKTATSDFVIRLYKE